MSFFFLWELFPNYVFKFQSGLHQIRSRDAMCEDKESGWFQLWSVISRLFYLASEWKLAWHKGNIILFFPSFLFYLVRACNKKQFRRQAEGVLDKIIVLSTAASADDGTDYRALGFIASLLRLDRHPST